MFKEKRQQLNSALADSSSKIIFDDKILCSQFLRDYIDLPYLRDVQPDDIEDVSEQFVPLFSEERNADRVKRVNIKNENPFFLISLIEHKSKVDYNVCMQILRYMIHIWEYYEKEAEKMHKGISKTAGFKYPPIIPIVYYEGRGKWSVPLNFHERVWEGDTFGKYLPDFDYYLVPLREFSNEDLMNKRDEISLVMLINKLQTATDIEEFRRIPAEQLEEIIKDSPEHLLQIISDILLALLLKQNVPVEEAEDLAGNIKEKRMGLLFENMEKIDIQEERRHTEEQRRLKEEERRLREEEHKLREMAEEKALRLFIEAYQELGAEKEIALQKLMEKFELNEEQASMCLQRYWV